MEKMQFVVAGSGFSDVTIMPKGTITVSGECLIAEK